MKPIVITRKYKHEAEQAISDLIKRGFYLVSPLRQVTSEKKVFARDKYNHKTFKESRFNSCWRAVLRRGENV